MNTNFDFSSHVERSGADLGTLPVETLQVNITKLCNQACHHCHVDSSPKRTEQMSKEAVDRCLELMDRSESIRNLDLTGGAPELNPHFDYFVRESRKRGIHVIVRHNLTVTLDGNPQTGESKEYLPDFYAEQGVEVVSSLPYYQEYFTDKQRGRGVFNKSMEAMKRLNDVGFGREGSKLELNLVYNPVGAFLPAGQEQLESDFKRELREKFDLHFNHLYTITNMPIHRFRRMLEKTGGYEEYMNKLVNAYNSSAAEQVMCRSMVSVAYDGSLFDCDFNQMLGMSIESGGRPATIFNSTLEDLAKRSIRFDSHCFGCTAGQGSSCGGATA